MSRVQIISTDFHFDAFLLSLHMFRMSRFQVQMLHLLSMIFPSKSGKDIFVAGVVLLCLVEQVICTVILLCRSDSLL